MATATPGTPPEGRYLMRSVIGRDGMGVVYLAEDMRLGRQVTRRSGDDVYPSFNPYGQRIVYIISRRGFGWGVYAMRADRSDDRGVFDSGGDHSNYALRRDGKGLRRLTDHPADDQTPFFAPDGQWLLFQSQRGGNWDLYRQPFDA